MFSSFFSSLKDIKMYKEIIMTHKNSTKEGRENPVTMEKKIIFTVILLEHCLVTTTQGWGFWKTCVGKISSVWSEKGKIDNTQ